MNRFTEQIIKRWCRRGDSNPHELPHTPLKRARLPVPPLRLVRKAFQKSIRYFFVDCGEGVITVEIGVGVGDAEGVGDGCPVGEGLATGTCSGTPDCRTELVPVTAGSESVKEIRKKAAAAPIVILASNV